MFVAFLCYYLYEKWQNSQQKMLIWIHIEIFYLYNLYPNLLFFIFILLLKAFDVISYKNRHYIKQIIITFLKLW